MNANTLTQIKARLETTLDDLETVRNAFIEHNNDDFEMQLSAFEAQEKVETVLRYMGYLMQAEDKT